MSSENNIKNNSVPNTFSETYSQENQTPLTEQRTPKTKTEHSAKTEHSTQNPVNRSAISAPNPLSEHRKQLSSNPETRTQNTELRTQNPALSPRAVTKMEKSIDA